MRGILSLLLIGIVLFGFGGCSLFEDGSTLIDNPTAKDIEVTIDDKTYTVPAGQYLKIDIEEEGTHKLSCPQYNLDKVDLIFDITKAGVINPTGAKYVIYYIIFSEKDLTNQFKPYEVEGKEVYSFLDAPKVVTDLFIPDRTLGKGNLDNDIPKSIDYNRMNQDYTFLNKIFRIEDFFKFYDENNK